jgi:DNA-binding NtrC family response regulator
MSNILVVDDGALITSWLCEMLRREGFRIELVAHEKLAVETYETRRHSLLVTNLRLPEGLEMVEELLSRNPRARVLALLDDELIHPDSVLNVVSVFGAVRVLRKPFRLETLLTTVADQLSEDGNRFD